MVKTETIEVYVCPYCGDKHSTWQNAVECECRESPEVVEEERFVCEMCGKRYRREEWAEECEQEHEENNDRHFQRWQEHREQERLLVIANHPGQRRLG